MGDGKTQAPNQAVLPLQRLSCSWLGQQEAQMAQLFLFLKLLAAAWLIFMVYACFHGLP